jgi:hypothetical protein
MDHEAALRGLRHVRNLNRAAKEAKARADTATEEAIVEAFKADLGITRIASESGVSESKIRAIRDSNGIPPNPSYAHLRPPPRTKEEGQADAS